MGVFLKKDIGRLKKHLGVKEIPGIHEQKLWEKVGKYIPYFIKIPGVQCICVGNSLAMNAAHTDSDIDLFIITKKNRLWTTRLFFTLFLSILGERKTHKKHAGKFCLSFFVTQDALSLKDIALKDDIYLSYWIETLKPIINREGMFEKFLQENSLLSPRGGPKGRNSLTTPLSILSCQERGSHIGAIPSPSRRGLGGGVWGEKLGNLLENLLKFLFLPRTKKSFQKLGKPYGVVITDTMLKFHDTDRRKKIRDEILSL